MISQMEQTVYRLSNLDTRQQKISYQMSTKKERIREFLTQDTQKIFGFNEIVTMFRKVLQ